MLLLSLIVQRTYCPCTVLYGFIVLCCSMWFIVLARRLSLHCHTCTLDDGSDSRRNNRLLLCVCVYGEKDGKNVPDVNPASTFHTSLPALHTFQSVCVCIGVVGNLKEWRSISVCPLILREIWLPCRKSCTGWGFPLTSKCWILRLQMRWIPFLQILRFIIFMFYYIIMYCRRNTCIEATRDSSGRIDGRIFSSLLYESGGSATFNSSNILIENVHPGLLFYQRQSFWIGCSSVCHRWEQWSTSGKSFLLRFLKSQTSCWVWDLILCGRRLQSSSSALSLAPPPPSSNG